MTTKTVLGVLTAGILTIWAGCGGGSYESAEESAGEQPAGTQSVAPPLVEFFLCVAVEPPDPALDLRRLHDDFRRKGPQSAAEGLRWLPLKDLDQWLEEPPTMITYSEGIRALRTTTPQKYFKVTRGLVVDVHEGKPYMLVYASADKCMTQEAGRPWKIVAARKVTDYLEQPAVEMEFDEAGSQLYERLYKIIEGNRYAILVDGEVVSAGYMTKWFRPSPSLLVAEMPEEEIDALIGRFD